MCITNAVTSRAVGNPDKARPRPTVIATLSPNTAGGYSWRVSRAVVCLTQTTTRGSLEVWLVAGLLLP